MEWCDETGASLTPAITCNTASSWNSGTMYWFPINLSGNTTTAKTFYLAGSGYIVNPPPPPIAMIWQ